MAITFVPGSKNYAISASANVTLFPGATTTAGNCIIVTVFANGTLSAITVTGPLAETPETIIETAFAGDGGNRRMGCFAFPNEVSYNTLNGFLVASVGAAELDAHFLEYSGVATSSVSDGSNHNWFNGSTSTTGDPGAISTTVADDLILGMSGQPSTSTVSAGSGYTIEVSSPASVGFKCDTEDQVVSGTGSFDPTFTYDVSAAWFCIAAAIKPAGVADTLLGQAVL